MQSFTSVLWLVMLPVLSLFILRQFVLAVLLKASFGAGRAREGEACYQAKYACQPAGPLTSARFPPGAPVAVGVQQAEAPGR